MVPCDNRKYFCESSSGSDRQPKALEQAARTRPYFTLRLSVSAASSTARTDLRLSTAIHAAGQLSNDQLVLGELFAVRRMPNGLTLKLKSCTVTCANMCELSHNHCLWLRSILTGIHRKLVYNVFSRSPVSDRSITPY